MPVKRAARSRLSSIRPRHFIVRLSVLALALPAILVTTASAQLPPTIAKAFAVASMPVNSSTSLTFTITNPNPATDLTGVAFTDTLPSGLTIPNPNSLTGGCDATGTTGTITTAVSSISLSGGQILATASCTFSIDVLAVSGGDQVNTTSNVSSNEGGTGGTATADVSVVLPDMTIAKSHSGNFRQGEAGAAYTITVTDSGGADTTDAVTVTDTLPPGLMATAISGVGWACGTPPALTCTRADSLAAGTSFPEIALTVNVAANAAPTVTNSATVSGGGESDTSNDTATDPTTVDQVADLIITKTHGGSFSRSQTGATWTLTVNNVGPGPTIGTVTVTDTLPTVQDAPVATAISGTGWACDLSALTCTRGDALGASASYPAITLTVNVPSNSPANVTNTATVSGGGELNTSNDTASDLTHVGAPLQIRANGGNLQVTPGGSTSITFAVDSSSGLGAINFSCGGLPVGANCSFNPSSESQLSATVAMTITTTGNSGSAWAAPPDLGRPAPIYAVVLLLLLGLLGIGVGWKTGRKTRLRLAVFAFGVVAALGFAGCNSSTSKSGTPPGNYQVTVTAASGTVQATTTVNLAVL